MRRFYFLSTGRTGTTLLSKMIAESAKLEISHQRAKSRRINILGNFVLLNKSFKKNLINQLINNFGSDGLPNSTIDPLRSIPLYIYLRENKDHSKYKIIHLVRDPRSFVTSFLNWKNSTVKRRFLHHFIPLWQPSPFIDENVSLFRRVSMSKFEHFCWIWNYKNSLFRDLGKRGIECYTLKFEDLINNETKLDTLKGLSKFMTTSLVSEKEFISKSKKVNSSSNIYFPEWRNWSKNQALTLHQHCGELMNKYGYGHEEEWKYLVE